MLLGLLVVVVPVSKKDCSDSLSPSSFKASVDSEPSLGRWEGVDDPVGVPVGVLVLLSILAFLEDDLGVMFALIKALMGVDNSSFPFAFGVVSNCAVSRRNNGDVVEPATRGVKGAF